MRILAFPESVHGTTFRHGEHLLIVEKSAEALAVALWALLNDGETARRLGAAARAHAVERYDWEPIARALESALLNLVETAGERSCPASNGVRPPETSDKPCSPQRGVPQVGSDGG